MTDEINKLIQRTDRYLAASGRKEGGVSMAVFRDTDRLSELRSQLENGTAQMWPKTIARAHGRLDDLEKRLRQKQARKAGCS